MSYVKITGANIGNCLTGFGINHSINIYNSGNSEVLYSIKNSNNTNFTISSNSFTVSPSDYGFLSVYYKPTISAGTDEITDLTISSISIEDGSVDPSGDITLNLTGTRLTDITGGNPRSFRVISKSNNNYPEYNFYWKAPTGISGSNLNNYFITGYRLQLSTINDFSSIVFTKHINTQINNNQDPLYSSYYGFGDNDIFYNLNTNEYSELKADTTYYARLHTFTVGHSGVSVYASGVDYIDQAVPQDVLVGYSGAPINIKIEKKPFNFYVTPNNTWFNYTYDLYSKLVESNNGSSNFSPYSGINVYLPENTVFESQDLTKGAIDLNGEFLNLTGSSAGTFINFYVPSSTEIKGRVGDGTNLYFQYNKTLFNGGYGYTKNGQPNNIIPPAVASSEYSDTSNGGPALSLKASTKVNNTSYTDFKYNFYAILSNPQVVNSNTNSEPKIASGSGGGKGGFFYAPFSTDTSTYVFYDTLDLSFNTPYFTVIPCNGTLPKNYLSNTQVNRKWWYWYLYYIASGFGAAVKNSTLVSKIGNPYIGYGEMGAANINYTKSNGLTYYIPESRYITNNSAKVNLENNAIIGSYGFVNYGYFFPINTLQSNRQPGLLADISNDAKISFSLSNQTIPSDYVFRFTQAGLTSATSWTGGSYTMSSSGGDAGSFEPNYKSLNYKCINLKNEKSIKIDFTSDINSVDFDLFLLCSFDNFTDPLVGTPSYGDIFDWYLTSNPNNVTKNQLSINQIDPLKFTTLPKENIAFLYKNSCLQDRLDVSKNPLTSDLLSGFFNGYKISKQLNSLSQISGISSNTITTTANHGLSNGDIVGFTGSSLPSEITAYDTVSPYTNKTYYVINATSSTFKISNSNGGSAITLSSGTGTILKLNSASLYRPFILQVRRIKNEYYYYINNRKINSYIANTVDTTLINNLKSTTLKLINRGSVGINYFDVLFYNRLLSKTELESTYTALVKDYFPLFAGEAGITSLDLKSNLYSYRLPNIFSLAGKT
jgi:hypothetical protein